MMFRSSLSTSLKLYSLSSLAHSRRFFSGQDLIRGTAVSGALVQASKKDLKVSLTGGAISTFDNVWLRDHCPCSKCRHPITKQRLLDTFAIPAGIKAREAKIENSNLIVKWSDGNHVSKYPLSFLINHSHAPSVRPKASDPNKKFKLWGRGVSRDVPVVQFDKVMASDSHVREWLELIEKYGFCLIKGVPTESTKDTEKLVRRISHIRVTHYGEFWDFTANLKHGDTAYTNLALGAHTDTTYFSDPVGLQLLHLIENKAKGGQTLLVDGFKVATELKKLNPKAFEVLTRIKVPSQYLGDKGIELNPQPRPIIQLNEKEPAGQLLQIRYNNNDRAPLSSASSSTSITGLQDIRDFYEALKLWNKILRDPANEFWFQLTPGTALIFDNWRVLHGRNSFTGGPRRMCGAYLNYDDYQSRLRTLRNRNYKK